MSAPGFYDATTLFSGVVSNTTYAYSNVLQPSNKNKICVYIINNPGAGVTSAQYKFQQSTNQVVWYDYPIDNIATAAISADTPPELYTPAYAWTQNFTSTSAAALGPFELTVGMPFFRVAYKIGGAGNLTTTIVATRILL